MLHKMRSNRDMGRKVSPPQPSFMTDEKKSEYLSSLRNNRPARPTGSRPLPSKSKSLPLGLDSHAANLLAKPQSDGELEVTALPAVDDQPRPGSSPILQEDIYAPKHQDWSTRSRVGQGRPLVESSEIKPYSIRGRKVSPTAVVEPPDPSSGEYRESGAKWMDRQEASSLREALEKIDHQDQERRIHSAAQNEAADLVWQHRNPKAAQEEKVAAYVNPDLELKQSGITGILHSGRRKSSGRRRASSGSGKVAFPNADEKIHEDIDDAQPSAEKKGKFVSFAPGPLKNINRNAVRGARPLPSKPPGADGRSSPFNRVDIYKNPPTQSRDAAYTMNSTPPAIDTIPEVSTPPSKNGLEIRGEDIRAATSMRRKDRSPKLPTPTAVSDVPGRPIVSFEPGWKAAPSSEDLDDEQTRGTVPEITVDAPSVPTINLPPSPEIPPINVDEASVNIPTISISGNDQSSSNLPIRIGPSRPLPQPTRLQNGTKPSGKPSSRLPWLNSASRNSMPTATCANCALPISGRIVTAAGAGQASSIKARFHPECFTCHHCSTALECVAFYPEPEDKRLARFEKEGLTENDVESQLRFYCHLDFHEFFSPRCKSCKTPIEGEVIVAAGAEWHVGHFFCSECGDPFDSSKPFVEKDGYAFCVSCHTKRTSARCRACKRQILDQMTVQALGGQWHPDCFTCYECQGGFGDDGRFFVRDVQVEGTEKEKRRGIMTRMEERAVCQGCEERRLKA